jgi:hypothetical protein
MDLKGNRDVGVAKDTALAPAMPRASAQALFVPASDLHGVYTWFIMKFKNNSYLECD